MIEPADNRPSRQAIPRFDHDTAQAWIERVESARESLKLAEQAGFITDREVAQQLDQVLAETHFVARALRNTIEHHGGRLDALERKVDPLHRRFEIVRHPLRELGERRYRRRAETARRDAVSRRAAPPPSSPRRG